MAATNENITINNQTLLNVNMTNVVKLNNTNYLMWSRQVHAFFDGYKLASYLDGSLVIPAPIIIVDSAPTINPNYTKWRRQDKLIYNALLGAISPTIQPLISRAVTAAQIWDTLAATYSKPSWSHIKQLKHSLKQSLKGNKTIDEYLQCLIKRFDQLAVLGKVIDHEDQVECVLGGLPEEYKSVVEQIEGRDIPPTLTEVHERLRNHEAKLLIKKPADTFPVTANALYHCNNTNNMFDNTRNNNHTPNWQQQQYQPQNDNLPPRPYQGSCQICGIYGHSARHCTQLQMITQPQRIDMSQQITSFTPWQPRANLSVGPSYNANNWLLDSRATHHITTDLNNLSIHQPYTSGDEVIIADSPGLPIFQTGSTLLPSPTRSLSLAKVLYMPNMYKTLIYVYRHCNSNQVLLNSFRCIFR